jgi:probable F420-dependent oxidoreductase
MGSMKVRIGFGLGVGTRLNDDGFSTCVDALEALRFDSLWLSERIGGHAPDPVVACAYAAGRTERLKFGFSVLVLPGRNPVVLAAELATLDRLAGGRLLPAFGLGVADEHEQQAFGVTRHERAGWFDEALPLLRRLWLEDSVDHDGARFHYRGLRVLPKPAQQPPDVWLGGVAPSELRRVGRLGDGWLPSFVTPADAAAAREVIEEVAAANERAIDPEHFGVLIPYVTAEVPSAVLDRLARRRPDRDPRELIATGWRALRERIEAFVEIGTSKFVVVPVDEPSADGIADHLGDLADSVLPLQT